MGMNFAFQLADKFRPYALLTNYPRSCRCVLLSQVLSKEHTYDFFFNTKVKGLVPCALPSLSMLHYHHSRLCRPPPAPDPRSHPGSRRAKFLAGVSRTCVHKPLSCGEAGAPGCPTGTGVGSHPTARAS